jgi:hypothetical protein
VENKMTTLNTYLQELFGIFAPSGEHVVDPIINKMNSDINKVYKSCDNIKEDNQKQICIKEKIIKIKKDTRLELVKAISQCEGRKPCHKIIATNTVQIDSELSELKSDITKLKRGK